MMTEVVDLALIPVLVETTKNSKPAQSKNHDYQEKERTHQLVPAAAFSGHSCVIGPFFSEKLRIFLRAFKN